MGVLWLDEVDKDDVPIVGGKAANLGELIRVGIPVPEGFVVDGKTYMDFLENSGLKEKIISILNSINVEDTKQLKEASRKVRELIDSTPMPKEVEEEIKQAYRKLCEESGEEVFVAVRSSATAEDLPGASFAGQQETYLNVRGEDEVVEKVKKCWSSLYTPRAIYYRVQKGFRHEDVSIAVVVQKMVNSEKSGVMFTSHPVTGEKVAIVEAVWGLGEAIVSGMVTPDHYEYDRVEKKIKKVQVAEKKFMLTRGEDGKTVKVELPPEKAKARVLSDEEIEILVKLGEIIEEHYETPQDVEWAIEKGEIYILQTQPITTIKPKPKLENFIEIEFHPPGRIPINSKSSLTLKFKPKITLEGLKVNIGKLKPYFEIFRFNKEVTQDHLILPPLIEGSEIIEELTLKPKYLGRFPITISVIWKDLEVEKSAIIEVTKEEIKLDTSIPFSHPSEPIISKTFPSELADSYIEVELIGKGGFARVFKAKRKDGKVVAIKIPISIDPAIGKSFIRELQNWTKLKHPNIVQVYDYNILPIPYIEMEFCEQSLADIPKPVHPEKAAWIIFNICEGLKYAHRLGIIHGDLKPQNIMLKDGIPKISDWGFSKVIAESTYMTLPAFTPLYAAPEMVMFKPKDQRTDIWQVGVIFYELVTGELPFKGDNIIEISMAIVTKQPTPPSQLNPEAKNVEPIIMKCLEKLPEHRYQSIEELQKDLSKYLSISYQRSLQNSISVKDFSRSAYYCGELLLINLKIKNIASAYKFASDLVNYAKKELESSIVKLCDELKFWLDREVPDDVIEELVKKAEVLVHKLRVGFKII